MDKYEYKIRSDEIKQLIAEGDYPQAAEIADTIDWRRVKSVMMLCTISDLYKINRRYEDAKNMLLLAYERRPGGRPSVIPSASFALKRKNSCRPSTTTRSLCRWRLRIPDVIFFSISFMRLRTLDWKSVSVCWRN